MRQIIVDTETTGLDPTKGHRIIEIGCVELINRRLTKNDFHRYLNPEREIEAGAAQVHGITNEFLLDKPLFKEVVKELIAYIAGAQLIIHNAPFDVGFLDHEFKLADPQQGRLLDHCTVLDTLVLARQLHPGQRNNLDALCKRYGVDNSKRDRHGALLDAEILAQVYLLMTHGQTTFLVEEIGVSDKIQTNVTHFTQMVERKPLKVIHASSEELEAHAHYLEMLEKKSGSKCLWKDDIG